MSVLAAILLAAAAAAQDWTLPPAPSTGSRVDYSADKVEFDSDNSTLHLSGNVVLKESTWTVKGEDLTVDTARRVGRSDAPLLLEDGVSAVYGESGEFDFGRHSGRLSKSKAGMADWRIFAAEGRMSEDRKLRYRGADFTSCGAQPPHYHFHASRVYVTPKKSMLATNVFFYLGKVPVFYTPILYRPLITARTWGIKTQPGYDRRNGAFLKNTMTSQFTDHTYSKLYLDWYSRQGFGYGGEGIHKAGEDSRGAIYGYRIKETSTGDTRWTFLGSGYQALGSTSTALQGRFQLQSDPLFNNAYARSSTFRVTPELINEGAVVHRFQTGTARLAYARRDRQEGTGYKLAQEKAPRLEYQSQPLRLPRLPWLHTFTGFAENSVDEARPFLQKSVNAGWEGTQSYSIVRGVSWTPRLGLNETYYDRFDQAVAGSSVAAYDVFVPRWTAGNTVRFRTPLGDVDASHEYAERLYRDPGAIDKGVERNEARLSDLWMPHRSIWTRISAGYDFRTFRDRTLLFRERVAPLVAEANWRAARKLDFTFRDEYSLHEGQRAFILDARWGDEEGAMTGFGVSHNALDPSRYFGSAEFAIAPSSPTWRLAFALHAQVETSRGPRGLHGFRVFDKEISWTHRWHDFHTRLAGRFRTGGVGEAQVRVDFKFGTTDPRQAPRRDWEAEWFPERAKQDVYRP